MNENIAKLVWLAVCCGLSTFYIYFKYLHDTKCIFYDECPHNTGGRDCLHDSRLCLIHWWEVKRRMEERP